MVCVRLSACAHFGQSFSVGIDDNDDRVIYFVYKNKLFPLPSINCFWAYVYKKLNNTKIRVCYLGTICRASLSGQQKRK